MTPQERADRSAQAMFAQDQATKWLGAEIESVGPGHACLTLTVAPHHCNGHGICHGGFIFTLADSAFAFACNSYNQSCVAQHNQISFIAPGKLGDTLTAEAREISRTGRSGIYDVTVFASDKSKVAEMRGCSRQIKGQHFEEAS